MENDNTKISLITFESAMSREERHCKRLLDLVILLILFWFLTIAIFVWYITLPAEETSVEYSQAVEDITESEISQTIGDNR